jgi:chloramphenicol-sensitive protein RarD
MQQSDNTDTPQGLALAITAYCLWGFLPIYLKWLSHVPPAEVVAHRIIWSIPVAGLVLVVLKRTKELRHALRTPKMLAMACLTAALISVNWGIYVWAIATEQAIDAALGYYINPLFSVALGAVLLGERLNRTQMAAIALALCAVVVLTLEAGRLPLISVGLMVTWGFYAFFKKSLPIGPNQGFMLEVLILSVPSIGYLVYLSTQGQGVFGSSLDQSLLLMGSGVVTAVPLIIYSNGAKLLRLSTIGILQYIAPTLIFLVAVFLFGEEMDRARMIAFPMIWAALVIYSIPMIRQMRSGAGR